MRGDVASAAVGTVAVQPVQHAAQRCRRDRRAPLHGLHDVAVGDEEADQRGQVVAAPVAAHESLAAADRAAERRIGVGLRVEHLDGRVKAAVRGAPAERPALAALDDRELAVAQLPELGEEDSPAEPLQQALTLADAETGRCRDDAVSHDGSLSMRPSSLRCPAPVLSGWVKNGVRLSHSRSACQ